MRINQADPKARPEWRGHMLYTKKKLSLWFVICSNKSSIWFVFNYEFLQLTVGKWKSSHVSWLWLIWIIFGTRWNASASWSCSTILLHPWLTTLLSLLLLLLLLFSYARSNLFICLFSLIFVQNLINNNFYCHDLRLGPHSRLRTSTIFRAHICNVIYMGTMWRSFTNLCACWKCHKMFELFEMFDEMWKAISQFHFTIWENFTLAFRSSAFDMVIFKSGCSLETLF